MGRPKEYDRDTILTAAMELFWLQGYEATSTRELVEHLGVNRNTMYTEFGSKRGLFDASLRHYEKTILDRNLGPLERPDAGVSEIEALFRHYVDVARRPGTQRGCLLCNSVVELSTIDGPARGQSLRFLDRARRAFARALATAQTAGSVRASVDPDTEAEYFTSTWLGMLVMLRGGADAAGLEAVADRAIGYLATLTSTRTPSSSAAGHS